MVIACPNCSRKLRTPETHAGRKATCPACHERLVIPHAEPVAAVCGTKELIKENRIYQKLSRQADKMIAMIKSPARTAETTLPQSIQDAKPIGADEVFEISRYRHGKEKMYFILAVMVSIPVWLFLIPVALPFAVFLIPVFISMLFARQYFKACIFGNSVRVSQDQYPEIHQQIQETAARLGLKKVPNVFVVNQGGINALALKFVGSKYIILYSSLVDLLLSSSQKDQLKMIIAHEMAHHAAGHVSAWKSLLIKPSKFIPFLGGAYRRACELTADRIGMVITRNAEASKNALMMLASGSVSLASKMNLNAFVNQESDIPAIFGFIAELYSSHPRLTKRIMALESFGK